jgi:hypothetical protein
VFFSSIILSILLGKLRGGTFRALSNVELKHIELIFLALLMRFSLYSSALTVSAPVAGLIHTCAFLLLALALYQNRHIVGFPIAMAGAVLNTAVIAANAGRMPVSQAALTTAGQWASTGESLTLGKIATHTLSFAGTRLTFLGDIMAFRWPWGPGAAFSVGDIVLIAGVFVAIQDMMGAGAPRRAS